MGKLHDALKHKQGYVIQLIGSQQQQQRNDIHLITYILHSKAGRNKDKINEKKKLLNNSIKDHLCQASSMPIVNFMSYRAHHSNKNFSYFRIITMRDLLRWDMLILGLQTGIFVGAKGFLLAYQTFSREISPCIVVTTSIWWPEVCGSSLTDKIWFSFLSATTYACYTNSSKFNCFLN